MYQCVCVVVSQGAETAVDYDSRSLHQFCVSHQLLLAAYELLLQQHNAVATTSMTSTSSDTTSTGCTSNTGIAVEHDIKSVSPLYAIIVMIIILYNFIYYNDNYTILSRNFYIIFLHFC